MSADEYDPSVLLRELRDLRARALVVARSVRKDVDGEDGGLYCAHCSASVRDGMLIRNHDTTCAWRLAQEFIAAEGGK